MKILVLSDSHGMLSFARQCIDEVRPDAVIHLGDMVQDADTLSRENPELRFYQVAGNCDSGWVSADYPEIRVENFNGIRIFMTHGHRHGVKVFLSKLISAGRDANADIVLFGHTHEAYCAREDDGMWVMNPGSAGYGSRAGVITVNDRRDITCRIIRASDLVAEK